LRKTFLRAPGSGIPAVLPGPGNRIDLSRLEKGVYLYLLEGIEVKFFRKGVTARAVMIYQVWRVL
jgi:hypothetical protein